jgi:ribonuclease-3
MTVNEQKLSILEDTIGIKFKNRDLLRQAFIHRSYLNENREKGLEHNERMEFLGDAVLELAVTEHLFEHYQKPEGVLTSWRSAIVRGRSLSDEAKKLKIDELLLTSRGEARNVGKAKDLLLANAFEALIGAIYIEHGYKKAFWFIERFLIYKLLSVIENGENIDPKGRFQELAQDKFSITPTYFVLEESGPDHNKEFVVSANLGDKEISRGNGSSKQSAQIAAAKAALMIFDQIKF